MSDREINIGEMMAPNSFDPMAVDTSEIRELSKAMPKDGNIDINRAETLATKYLRGADMCSELSAISAAHVSRAKDSKQRAYNQAFLNKSVEHKHIKTDKMRIAFAELDEDYQKACEEYNKAYAFEKWITSKQNIFLKAHYMCKHILNRELNQESASSWNGKPVDSDSGW